jgi:hypothetical protein
MLLLLYGSKDNRSGDRRHRRPYAVLHNYRHRQLCKRRSRERIISIMPPKQRSNVIPLCLFLCFLLYRAETIDMRHSTQGGFARAATVRVASLLASNGRRMERTMAAASAVDSTSTTSCRRPTGSKKRHVHAAACDWLVPARTCVRGAAIDVVNFLTSSLARSPCAFSDGAAPPSLSW